MSDTELWRNRTIALAGLAQSASAVDQLARSGYLDTELFATAAGSLFEQNPAAVAAVFGGEAAVASGAQTLIGLLQTQLTGDRGNPILNYSLGAIHLQRLLQKRPRMLDEVGQRLAKAQHQREHFGTTHDNVVANLADIYTSTLSTLRFRIHVTGEYQYLQQPRLAAQVRVLLFAGVRAAMLWRQLGGSRLHFILHRQNLIDWAETLRRP